MTLLFGYAFGIAWLDAFIRVVIATLVMTVLVMLLIWFERKFLGRIQQRLGPTRTGPIGILQSVADAGKLLSKEDLRPTTADRWVFELAVFAIFVPIFLGFLVLPYTDSAGVRVDMRLGLLYVIAVSSISIVGMLMAGFASDSKYAIIGVLRSVAQLIAYEVPLVLSALAVALMAGTLDLREIVRGQDIVPNIVWQPLGFFIFIVAATAELGRRPFDIPVSESEMVGGPTVEYSGIRWSMFQLAEYANLIIMSIFGSILFLGGYAWPFGLDVGWGWQLALTAIKAALFILLFMWINGTFPRLRIDQVMSFAWKVLIPLSFVQVFVTALVRAYGWPDIIMTIVCVPALIIAFRVVARNVRTGGRRPREQRLAYLQAKREAAQAAGRVQ